MENTFIFIPPPLTVSCHNRFGVKRVYINSTIITIEQKQQQIKYFTKRPNILIHSPTYLSSKNVALRQTNNENLAIESLRVTEP